MKKLTSFLVILILAVSVSLVAPASSGSPDDFRLIEAYWGTDQPIEVSPGDVATLTVVLRYESSWSFSNLKADLSLPEGLEAVGDTTVHYAGPISIGSLIELRFPVFITEDVEKGKYKAVLTVEYYISRYVIPKEELEIRFEVTGKPSIDIRALNDTVYEGKQELLVEVSNEGDAALHNLEITGVYSSGVSLELVGDEFLGSLDTGDNITVSMLINVPAGMKGMNLPLTVEFRYLGPKNTLYMFSETLLVPVKPSSPISALTLDLDTRELSIGKSSKVYIELMNVGDDDLSEISLTLSPDNILKVFGPMILHIDRLKPGEEMKIETEVYIPSTTIAPTGSITIMTTYFDEDAWLSQSETHQLTVLLRGLIEISLTDFAVIPSTPRSGSPFSITVTITNIGTSTAYAAYAASDLEGLPLSTFGPKSTYIGNIETNLPTTFTVNLQVGNTTNTSITLPVTLRYMDNLRSLHNITFQIPIDVLGPSTSGSSSQERPGIGTFLGVPGLGIFIVVAIVAVAVAIIWRWRKKRE